jgi:hypothetical protein
MERLKALKNKSEAASYTEVIKNSFRLYEAPIAEADEKSRDGTGRLYRKIF